MTAIAHHPHRVTRAVAGVRAQLTSVADVPVWSMDAGETTATLDDVPSAKAQLAELEARLLSHADRIEIAAQTGATQDGELARPPDERHPRPTAFRASLADGLDAHELTRDAMAEAGSTRAGRGNHSARSTSSGGPRPRERSTRRRRTSSPTPSTTTPALRILGRRRPRGRRPRGRRRPRSQAVGTEERDAAAATRLVMWDDGHGKVHGKFTLPALEGATFKKALSRSPPPSTAPPPAAG